MKNCCFNNEILQFKSVDEFHSIINQIDSKRNIELIEQNEGSLGKPKMNMLGLGFGGKTFMGEAIYRCHICNKTWYLSDPEFPWKGYLRLTSKKEN